MPVTSKIAMTVSRLQETIKQAPNLSQSRRKDLLSAINRVIKICGLDPHSFIVDPASVSKKVYDAPWQLHGITKATWANIRSNFTAAIEIAGINIHRLRANFALTPEWDSLFTRLDEFDRRDMRRFAGWCAGQDLTPKDVTQKNFLAYYDWCVECTVNRDPRERAHLPRRVWNQNVRKILGESAPVLELPGMIIWKALGWAELAPTLKSDFEIFRQRRSSNTVFSGLDVDKLKSMASGSSLPLNNSSGLFLFGKAKLTPLKPVTIQGYENRIRVLVTLLVELGTEPAQLNSFKVLLTRENVFNAMVYYVRGQDDDRAKPRLTALAIAVLSIAQTMKAHGEMDDATLADLRDLFKKVQYRQNGMSKCNRERLQQFKSSFVLKKFLNLPSEVFQRLDKIDTPKIQHALDAQQALILAILQHAPVRCANLQAINLGQHLKQFAWSKETDWMLHWDSTDVKNKQELNFTLKGEVSRLLEIYLKRYRPILMNAPSSALFISHTGTQKCTATVGKQFKGFIKRELGLVMNIHLIRHLSAYIFLKHNPGHYGTVQVLLGHKNIQTTINFYAGFNQETDLAHYDKLIERLKNQGKIEASYEDTL